MTRLLCLFALLGALGPACASQWRVDLIVFADREQPQLADPELRVAADAELPLDAIPLDDEARLRAAGIRLLPPGDSLLSQQWSRIANSQRFEPVLRIAWLQDDPPARGGPRILLQHGPEVAAAGDRLSPPVHQLQGSLRLNLRRFLHLDVDLQWTDTLPGENGPVRHATRIREQRRMRSQTLHHLDSPRFGVLAHILRVDD